MLYNEIVPKAQSNMCKLKFEGLEIPIQSCVEMLASNTIHSIELYTILDIVICCIFNVFN